MSIEPLVIQKLDFRATLLVFPDDVDVERICTTLWLSSCPWLSNQGGWGEMKSCPGKVEMHNCLGQCQKHYTEYRLPLLPHILQVKHLSLVLLVGNCQKGGGFFWTVGVWGKKCIAKSFGSNTVREDSVLIMERCSGPGRISRPTCQVS